MKKGDRIMVALGIIGLLLVGYLCYVLMKPEKF